MNYQRTDPSFFQRDVLSVAPELLGKIIVRDFGNNDPRFYVITEVEAYRGEDDLACHASKGRTKRTEAMYALGGSLYVYLIYGMYWMLNIVTGKENEPQAVLIRGIDACSGPGRVARELRIDKSFYGEALLSSCRIWIADSGLKPEYHQGPRIGIVYAGECWASMPWRFWY
jgi:DNA-3-methyladenine glycosylase